MHPAIIMFTVKFRPRVEVLLGIAFSLPFFDEDGTEYSAHLSSTQGSERN